MKDNLNNIKHTQGEKELAGLHHSPSLCYTDFFPSRGFACIGLDNPKTPANIGSVLRAAGNFNVAMVAISGKRYQCSSTDTMKSYRHRPFLQVDDLKSIIPYNCIPIAVDLIPNAIPLPRYVHPERAFYIFGAEDATLGHRTLSFCRDVIYVPTNQCMNLAGTVHVILYDRMVKSV
ncbi:MAG TPA: TrmH family RNA methyltransferase [candidate division Zixibacteria bacterium]|nr:TrmH family RNA methyltransferase [candidate division Zixibacteria bacterium]